MQSQIAFQYSSLPHMHIRVLEISSIDHNGYINCQLTSVSLMSEFNYDALSYAWGSGRSTAQISCNGASLKVTADLHEALRCLYLLKQPRPIWIDAISINQRLHHEKEDQVAIMGEIYARADTVRIWIGPSSRLSIIAMDRIATLSKAFRNIEGRIPSTDSSLLARDLPAQAEPVWEGLDELFTRSWFRRLWTVQEYALARDEVFVCGPKFANGSDMAAVANGLRRTGLIALSRRTCIPEAGTSDGYHFTVFPDRVRLLKARDESVPFDYLLQSGRFKDTPEPIDRVYGILGLADEIIRSQLPIDYNPKANETYWELYVVVGKLALKTSETLNWLALCTSKERPEELPSWCPNLKSRNTASLFFYECYRAGSSKKDMTSRISFPPDTDHLLRWHPRQ